MKRVSCHAGFSLVEVAMAIAVTSFCLIALLGLLFAGNASNASNFRQTSATSLATEIISDLRTTPVASGGGNRTTLRYKIPLPNEGSGTGSPITLFFDDTGTPSGLINTDASSSQTPMPLYRATLTFTAPAAGSKASDSVRVLITWPAIADKSAATAPTNFIGSFDAVVGLDCN